VCQGRGEVDAGITGNVRVTGHDAFGHPIQHPTAIWPNPDAKDAHGHIWILKVNEIEPLWGIAVCQRCRGVGTAHEQAIPG
jgi:hypothetical protein